MINLLPPKRLLSMRIARTNTILRRYLELTLLSVVVIAGAVVAAYFILNNQQHDIQKTLAINQAKVKKLEPIQKEAEQLSATITTIARLMSKNVKFSEMLTQIGSVMPPGSSLTGLQFSLEDTTSPLIVSAQVASEERAAVLRNNLANSLLFKDAKIVTITEIKEEKPTENDPAAPAVAENPYKYTVTINAYFKDNLGATKQ
jgi:Tfp pilus assembly protein PilN